MTDSKNDRAGAPTRGMNRRRFLGISSTAAALAGLPAWFPKMAFSQITTPTLWQRRCTLIKVFGRGGWDGLSMCIPYSDPQYYLQRPLSKTLAFTQPGSGGDRECLDLDGQFGFPKAMERLKTEVWDQGHLAIVNAIGLKDMHSNSHFVQQLRMETAPNHPDDDLATGWLGRHLATRAALSGQSDPVVRGLGVEVALPRVLHGGTDAIAAPDPHDYNLKGDPASVSARLAKLRDMYFAEGEFDEIALKIGDYIDALADVDFANYQPAPGADYPEGVNDPEGLGQALKCIAAIMEAGVRVEVFAVDFGGWDHHVDQDPHHPGGKMYDKMNRMSKAFAAFYIDMIAKSRRDWIIYANSEFGRKLRENNNQGTDHGVGNCMFLASPQIKGGIHGPWPGLPDLSANTLPIGTDIRDVAAEMVDRALINRANLGHVFPGHNPSYLNIFKRKSRITVAGTGG